jgi:hypothetical protein
MNWPSSHLSGRFGRIWEFFFFIWGISCSFLWMNKIVSDIHELLRKFNNYQEKILNCQLGDMECQSTSSDLRSWKKKQNQTVRLWIETTEKTSAFQRKESLSQQNSLIKSLSFFSLSIFLYVCFSSNTVGKKYLKLNDFQKSVWKLKDWKHNKWSKEMKQLILFCFLFFLFLLLRRNE